MVSKIEVYIRNENVVVGLGEMRPLADHPCLDRTMTRIEKVLSESDQLALRVAQEFADERGLLVEVHNVSDFKGRLKALLKGVSKTPTIIVGDSRVEGDLTSEQLKNELESCLGE